MIELVMFDLDNTLLNTSDLEQFRGQNGLGQKTQKWVDQLGHAYDAGRNRVHYSAAHLHQIAQHRKVGVFTRSPRAYAHALLNKAYPGFPWSIVIAYEDVTNTKPHPEGLLAAMKHCGLDSPDKVALVGDEKVDILAAYRAGCWSFLDRGLWAARLAPDNYRALERIPDMVFAGPDELIARLEAPIESLPELERSGLSASANGSPRFDSFSHLIPLAHGGGGAFITSMGRLFSNYDELKNRSSWHQLTHEIADHKDATVFPSHWIESVRTFVRESWPVKNGRDTIVTVVPFKPGRAPRLEHLLAQLANSQANSPISRFNNISFTPDLMSYKDGVKSHNKEHLDRDDRFQNVKDHLVVNNPGSVLRKHVIVIDDVVTTGASLIYASKYLRDAGASNVHCLALAQAIGPQ